MNQVRLLQTEQEEDLKDGGEPQIVPQQDLKLHPPLPPPSETSSETPLQVKQRLDTDLLQHVSREAPKNQIRIKQVHTVENREEHQLLKKPRLDFKDTASNCTDIAFLGSATLDDGLCIRCRALDLKDLNNESPSSERPLFKVVARLGTMDRLLNHPECQFCQLLYKVRPAFSSDCNLAPSECSLVVFDGRWARPWKIGLSSKNNSNLPRSSKQIVCLDSFAMIDEEIMLGVLPSKGVEDPRSNTVPYLHDRLYESVTRSGYIRIAQNPSLETSKLIGPRPVRSTVNWNFLRSSLYQCDFNHSETCGKQFDNDYDPLKVIDCQSRKVVAFTSPLPYRKMQYIALSYIWGSQQSSTRSVSQDDLPDVIPATISDAMDVTLKLGFRFLWVDRYCIPQNDHLVKHKEIRHMDMIYKGAAATIIACSGASPWHGLPGCSSRLRPGSHRISIQDKIFFSVPSDPRYEIEASNWMSRGWTYQEGLLSRRRIFFTEDQTYFECDDMHAFESTHPLLNRILLGTPQKARVFSIRGKKTGRHDFFKTVNEYSVRKLTYDSDILNGVWGVLRTFQDANLPTHHYWGVPIFATHFSHECIAGFAWDLVRPAKRRCGFPSWSWSGWIGQVKPDLPVRLDGIPQRSPDHITTSGQPIRPLSGITDGSNFVEIPDILQTNLPTPLEDEITLWIERINGGRIPYLNGSLRYSNFGGLGLSAFLYVVAWMMPTTIAPSGRPRGFVSTPYVDTPNLQWMPTIDETTTGTPETLNRHCTAILLAVRGPFTPKAHRLGSPEYDPKDPDIGEGQSNRSWICLFLVVEKKEECFERIGLLRFMVQNPLRNTMDELIKVLSLERNEIRLG